MSDPSTPVPPAPGFAALGIAAPILQAIGELGYEQPTPIQAQAIPLLIAGKNLLGTAQTGTGKTAAFALPLLSRLQPKRKAPQILVLTPTRELAIQVAEAFQAYARHLGDFHVLPIYGGQPMFGQLRALERGVAVVVGTPGRVMDHLRRKSLDLSGLQATVLDEADEMLRMGFIDDVDTILAQTPADSQRALFSATMPPAIRRIAARHLGVAEEVRIVNKTATVERIEQGYLMVHNSNKLAALTRILEVEEFDGLLIFVRTKSATVDLAERLAARGFAAVALNGDLSQAIREQTITKLKRNQIDIVVATDVAARGLDVDRISHVINFDIPNDPESYVHRIGRTARAGRTGKAILLVTPKEQRLLRAIESATRQPLRALDIPSGEEVSDRRVERFQQTLLATLGQESLSRLRELVEKMAHDNELDIGAIAAALAWQVQRERPLFPKLDRIATAGPEPRPAVGTAGKRSANAKTATKPQAPGAPPRAARSPRPATEADGEVVRYRIDVGTDHGALPKDIVGAIANEIGIPSRQIGRIEMFEEHSTVDLPAGMPNAVLSYLKKVRIRQRPTNIAPLAEDAKRPSGEGRKPVYAAKKPAADARKAFGAETRKPATPAAKAKRTTLSLRKK